MSDEVWMWMHWKYRMSQIVQKFIYSKQNKNSYLYVPDDVKLNWQNNEVYDLQFTNSKIITTTTIIINSKIMHCIINMYNSEQLYWYK